MVLGRETSGGYVPDRAQALVAVARKLYPSTVSQK